MAEYIERSAAIEAEKHAWAKGLEPSQYIEALPAADIAQCRELPCPYNGACSQRKVWERLKAYEDTGLEPAMCANYKTFEDEAISKGVTFKRIVALMEADRAGRLVVLPCKVGDELWTFCSYPVEKVYSFTVTDISTLNGRTTLNTSRCGVIDARDVGKTVFLTREKAEKALEAKRDVCP